MQLPLCCSSVASQFRGPPTNIWELQAMPRHGTVAALTKWCRCFQKPVYSWGHSIVVATTSCQVTIHKCQVLASALALGTLALVPKQMLVMTGSVRRRLGCRCSLWTWGIAAKVFTRVLQCIQLKWCYEVMRRLESSYENPPHTAQSCLCSHCQGTLSSHCAPFFPCKKKTTLVIWWRSTTRFLQAPWKCAQWTMGELCVHWMCKRGPSAVTTFHSVSFLPSLSFLSFFFLNLALVSSYCQLL